jgi:O-antigen/teichoic acid export membrane protein
MTVLHRLVSPRKISVITEISKAGIAAITFLLMALLLGPTEYGAYVQFAAMAGILVPIASVGYASWVQPLANRDGVADAASACTSIVFVVGLPVTAVSILITNLVFPDHLQKLAAVFLVEMLLFPLWSSLTLSFLSDNALVKYFLTSVSVPLVKLIGTIAALTVLDGGLEAWGTVLVPLGLLGLFCTATIAKGRGPIAGYGILRRWLRRGTGFAIVGTASAATDNVDKLMVGSLGGAAAAGNYGVASRFAAYAVIPVRAIALVAYPHYFRLAEDGDFRGLRRLMYRTIRKGLWLGCGSAALAATALFIASLTILKQYEDTVPIGCVLALLIPLRSIQYAAGDVTYAIGKSHWRLFMTLSGAAITSGFVGAGLLFGGSLGAAIGAVAAAVIISGMLIIYVERWIKKNSIIKKRGRRRALLHNNS